MVRTRQFDPAETLGQVVQLFRAKGYAETSMEDIVEATGVSRYGLYSTFGNKRELFEHALERYADKVGRGSFMRLLDDDASLADIRRVFAERVEVMCDDNDTSGCLLTHTATELAPHDADMRDVVLRFLKRMSRGFAIGIESAQARGEARADLDPKAGGDFLTGAFFGLVVMARAGFPKASLEAYVDSTIASLAAH